MRPVNIAWLGELNTASLFWTLVAEDEGAIWIDPVGVKIGAAFVAHGSIRRYR